MKSGTTPKYTDEQVSSALALLAQNSDNLTRTAKELGWPRSSLRNMRDKQRALMAGIQFATTDVDRARDPVLIWEKTAQKAVAKMSTLLDQDDARLRDVSYAVQVSSEQWLNHRDGRKGMEISVDARSVILPALSDLTTEELRSLVSLGEGGGAAPESG